MRRFYSIYTVMAWMFLCASVTVTGFILFSGITGKEHLLEKDQSQPHFKKVSRGMFVRRDKITNLFGQKKEPVKVVADKNQKPVFSLKGIASISGGPRYAVIENNAGKQVLVHEGDVVDGWLVERIDTNERTLILSSNNRENVTVHEEKKKYRVPRRTADQAEFHQLNTNTWQVKRSDMIEASSNMNTILKNVRLIPHFSGDKASGYFLTNIKKGSLVEQAGFKNGDVVSKINGNSLSDLSSIVSIYGAITKNTEIDVEIKRNGKVINQKYRISD